jgi:hypothetical protein
MVTYYETTWCQNPEDQNPNVFFVFSKLLFNILFLFAQVMETEKMIYLVTEYASGGEIFGKF